MTFWKVDYRTDLNNECHSRWFRSSRDAELFCDAIPGGFYEKRYYCREVAIPDSVVLAVEKHWKGRISPASVPPRPISVAVPSSLDVSSMRCTS